MELVENGVYIVKDSYFQRFDNGFLMQNKQENRPAYYAIKDKDGIYWMVPFSSRVENYKQKVKHISENGGSAFFEFGLLHKRETAFLVWNMFPVTEEYISRAYTWDSKPYLVQDRKLIKRVNAMACRYLNMLERGAIRSSANVLDIKKTLLAESVMPV